VKLPELRIGNLKPEIPIIQGGMAVRISTSKLAAAVAAEGGIGIIAGSGMSIKELREEIRMAKAMTTGIIGVNIMFAVTNFAELMRIAIEEKIDLLVAGAGFSRDMFGWGREAGIPVVPIVSTVKLAKISEKLGASAIIVEGKEAGGHLGTDQSVRSLLPEIKNAVSIPVIAAGGIVDKEDLHEILELGADGVQMGIRFAASEESNADIKLKEAYVNAKKEDIILIESPVGLPGRAIRNAFTDRIGEDISLVPQNCLGCLKDCARSFCILDALRKAQEGDLYNGLIFSGEFIEKIREILPVKEIIRNLLR
jgi:NAD(P)H-dependent flavin oxidoreductase YrpB (nitropropane dioxygenase family)